MAKERNMIGFETGTSDEFDLFQAGCSIVNNTAQARTGDWFLRLAPAAQLNQARIAGDGIIQNVSAPGGVFTRGHTVVYMRVNALPSSGSVRLLAWETLCEFWITNAGQTSINFVGHGGTNAAVITADGLWHRIDLVFTGDGGSPSTNSWAVAVDNGAFTTVTQVNAGAQSLPEFTFGNNISATFSIDFDDFVNWQANGTDAASAITMPVATRILPTPVTANGTLNQWSNTYVNVQDVPPSTAPDTFQAGTSVGQAVTYQKGDLSWFDIPGNEVDGLKIYGWLRHSGSGTKSVQVTINGTVVNTITTYPLIPVGYPTAPLYRAAYDWTVRTIAQFDALEYGFIQNGTCQINAGSVFMEILVLDVVPLVNSITPNTGTWKGGTFFTVTGLYFTPTTQILFGADGAATAMVWTDSKHMSGLTPPNPSGAGPVNVTAQ